MGEALLALRKTLTGLALAITVLYFLSVYWVALVFQSWSYEQTAFEVVQSGSEERCQATTELKERAEILDSCTRNFKNIVNGGENSAGGGEQWCPPVFDF